MVRDLKFLQSLLQAYYDSSKYKTPQNAERAFQNDMKHKAEKTLPDTPENRQKVIDQVKNGNVKEDIIGQDDTPLQKDEDDIYLTRFNGSSLRIRSGRNAQSYNHNRRKLAGMKSWIKHLKDRENRGEKVQYPSYYKKQLGKIEYEGDEYSVVTRNKQSSKKTSDGMFVESPKEIKQKTPDEQPKESEQESLDGLLGMFGGSPDEPKESEQKTPDEQPKESDQKTPDGPKETDQKTPDDLLGMFGGLPDEPKEGEQKTPDEPKETEQESQDGPKESDQKTPDGQPKDSEQESLDGLLGMFGGLPEEPKETDQKTPDEPKESDQKTSDDLLGMFGGLPEEPNETDQKTPEEPTESEQKTPDGSSEESIDDEMMMRELDAVEKEIKNELVTQFQIKKDGIYLIENQIERKIDDMEDLSSLPKYIIDGLRSHPQVNLVEDEDGIFAEYVESAGSIQSGAVGDFQEELLNESEQNDDDDMLLKMQSQFGSLDDGIDPFELDDQSPEEPPKSPKAPPKSPEAPPKSPEAPPKSPEAPPKSPEAAPKSPEAPPKSPEAVPKSPEEPTEGSETDSLEFYEKPSPIDPSQKEYFIKTVNEDGEPAFQTVDDYAYAIDEFEEEDDSFKRVTDPKIIEEQKQYIKKTLESNLY